MEQKHWDIAETVIRRTWLLKKYDKYQQSRRWHITALFVICVLCAVILSWPGLFSDAHPPLEQAQAATSVAEGALTGGYIVTGTAGFSLGMAASLVCGKLRKK